MSPKFYLDYYIKMFQQADVSFRQKARYFVDQTEPQKLKVTFFNYENECYQKLGLEKKMEKWGHLSSFYPLYLNYGS